MACGCARGTTSWDGSSDPSRRVPQHCSRTTARSRCACTPSDSANCPRAPRIPTCPSVRRNAVKLLLSMPQDHPRDSSARRNRRRYRHASRRTDMTSAAMIRANRRNALRSTGPRSLAGKAIATRKSRPPWPHPAGTRRAVARARGGRAWPHDREVRGRPRVRYGRPYARPPHCRGNVRSHAVTKRTQKSQCFQASGLSCRAHLGRTNPVRDARDAIAIPAEQSRSRCEHHFAFSAEQTRSARAAAPVR